MVESDLCSSYFTVFAADPSGDGGFPEEAGRVLRGVEAVSEECVHSERVLSVSLRTAPHFCAVFAAAAPFYFKYLMCCVLGILCLSSYASLNMTFSGL